jgi:hypothetical protein
MTPSEERALSLLGAGVSPVQTAAAIGISESRISQLLSQEEFATQVALLRYNSLAANTERDNTYDSLEDAILTKLKSSLELVYQPMMLAKILQIVNAAKRRGNSSLAASDPVSRTNIVNITIPTVIKQKFITNTNNQVVSAGSQDLVTIQPASLIAAVNDNSKNLVALKNFLMTLPIYKQSLPLENPTAESSQLLAMQERTRNILLAALASIQPPNIHLLKKISESS